MYAFKTVFALAVPLMAVANPLVRATAEEADELMPFLIFHLLYNIQVVRTDTPTSCNTGDVQCCNQVQNVTYSNILWEFRSLMVAFL